MNRVLSKNKERLSKKSCEKCPNISEEEKDKKCQYAREQYRNLSEEEKEKKCQYSRERYKNLLEDGKQRLVEYIKIFEILLSASGYSKKKFFLNLYFYRLILEI